MTVDAPNHEQLTDAQIERVAELAGVLNVANARLVALMAEVLEHDSWSGNGVYSPAQWLAWKSGVSPERAKDIVRVASRRSEFPTIMAAFEAGELTLEQVAVLVKAPAWADADILHWGRVATVARLRKTIRRRWFAGDPDEPDPDPSSDDRDRITTSATDEHRWRINGELDLGRGELVEAALREARESLFERGQADISSADCLAEVCERYLDGIGSAVRRDRSKTWVHLDVTDGAATTSDGWRLPDHVRDHLTCDGLVQPVWERDGTPFSVGRTQRIVPERTRRIVMLRDQGCRAPGCTHDRVVEIHHIVHWVDGGPTDTWNLVCLRPKHHRLHHLGKLGKLGIAGNDDGGGGLVFTDWKGRTLQPAGSPTVPTEPLQGPETRYQPPLEGRVDYTSIGLGWVHPNELKRRRAASRARGDECTNPPTPRSGGSRRRT